MRVQNCKRQITAETSHILEDRDTHRRRVACTKPLAATELTGNRFLDCLFSCIDPSKYFGVLLRKIDDKGPPYCRWCGPCADETPNKDKSATRDPAKWWQPVIRPHPACQGQNRLATKQSCIGHIERTHNLPHEEAVKMLKTV